MDNLIASAHQDGLNILENKLFSEIKKFQLIDRDDVIYYTNSIHSSFIDNEGFLTVLVIIPKENDFQNYNTKVRILNEADAIIAEVQTPQIQFISGIGGEQKIKFNITDEPGKIVFRADEYLTYQEVMHEVDKFRRPPIGTISFELLENPREYQIKALGEEFNRADYPKLWEFLKTQPNLILSERDWQSQNSSNGMCGYYSRGDDSRTFRVPNLLGATLKGVSTNIGRYEADENKAHNHTGTTSSDSHSHTGTTSSNTHNHGVYENGSHDSVGTGSNACLRSNYSYGAEVHTTNNTHNHSFSTSTDTHNHTITVSTQGTSENRVKNIGVLPLLVAK